MESPAAPLDPASSSPPTTAATDPVTPTTTRPAVGLAVGGVVSGALQTIFYLGYPLIVYVAYTRLETRSLALLLLALYVVSVGSRVRGSRAEVWRLLRQHAGLGVLIGIAVATGNRTVLLFLPCGVNLYLLWTFSSSLRNGPPMIERFARMVEDDLPDFTLPYCRKVTAMWCVFLGANAAALVILALVAPVEWWALYTGLISYLLIGLLLGGEFVFRKLWFRYYNDHPADRVLAWAFPPQRTANGRRSLAYVAQREAGRTEADRHAPA